MFSNLLKAVVGVVVDLPVSLVKNTITLGGAITNEPSAVAKSCRTIKKNIEQSIDPKED